MTAWLLALLAGPAFAALQYGRLVAREGTAPMGMALLRAAAVTLLVALLLDVRIGPEQLPAPLVALDASESWTRGDTTRWSTALARARSLAGDSLVLTGDSVRLADDTTRPTDAASSIATLAEQSIAEGRPLVVVTDGEITASDAAALAALPRGSRFEVPAAPATVDAAVASLDAPRSVATGDTLEATVTIRSGAMPLPASVLTMRLDDVVVATRAIPALGAYATRDVPLTVRVHAADGVRVLRAIVTAPGDAEPRNDTLGAALDVSSATNAVWISSAPDLDGREALAVLRGALAVPTRAYLRVAPGTWRVEGSLEAVSEAVVRQAAQQAAMLVVHGDTAVFGAPRSLAGTAPLALLPGPGPGPSPATPAAGALDEWYPSAAPASPASAALSGVAWDSLAPVSLGDAATLRTPAGGWVALEGRRGRRGDAAPFIVGSERPRRIVVARATGMWRWQARGGGGAIAYAGLWGSLFDWLADARRDRRAATPANASVRVGEAVRWRISVPGDSPTPVTLARRGDAAGTQTVMLVASPGTMFAESPALAPGVYDAESAGGRSVVVVNASRELMPQRPAVTNGPHGSGAVAGAVPALRDYGVAYAVIVVLLCVEWVLRRRRGLR